MKQSILESIQVKNLILRDAPLLNRIEAAAESCIQTFQDGGKVLLCGNGGSAADAQHIAAELSGRFAYDRPPLFAEALHVNSSYLTAVANDYGFETVFSRLVEAMGKQGDILIGLSTSGNSPNIVAALKTAKELGLFTIAMTGQGGGLLKQWADLLINIPSTHTARIQEAHILIGHLLSERIEQTLFPL
ncbi:MAG: D-sedoheptulose 7-phosphate isomerase [Bacteroidales bacterium]|jgi:D-sedoheptulose 7-phosphate isomerase|nr:D-sedoheptulose 7-phosphate isomerase [Bacteroidales bacterium]MCK9447706.1 D-sedoheptulose 7-phosphate isomerase [Bacteroidales bacterium]MDD3700211.1 D-sedoheptulose 7-phosphate isomerase [Bacteroidales bacterium]MDY0370071.1 D-sedoheptulose 7-phosphate isomerase [Bacteroidales bacterium]